MLEAKFGDCSLVERNLIRWRFKIWTLFPSREKPYKMAFQNLCHYPVAT